MNFPKLIDNQVAVLRAEFNTGIIVDENFVRYNVNTQQKAFSVFDNYDAAIAYTTQFADKPFEFIIYDNNEKELAYIKPAKY